MGECDDQMIFSAKIDEQFTVYMYTGHDVAMAGG